MVTRYAVGPREYARMNTQELRDTFLLQNLFVPGEVNFAYWETDRAVVGAAVPTDEALVLQTAPELAADYFCERRELGVLNLGGPGKIVVDGTEHALRPCDGLYVSRGTRDVSFASDDPAQPARFYLLSYPAHAAHPTTHIPHAQANRIELGTTENANRRTLFQYIHEGGVQSCQLVMGFTRLEHGSVWNTMPPHTHARRSEIYLYFDLPADAAAFHFMGPGDEMRHLLVHAEEAVLSPVWSIHAGCGTTSYAFVWGMGGENQRFADMDGVPIAALR